MRKLFAAVAIALLITGCSAPESGTVIGKNYSPASYWTDYQCTQSDPKTGLCLNRMAVQHVTPESWCLVLVKGDAEGCRSVDQITFHKYQIGQEYP